MLFHAASTYSVQVHQRAVIMEIDLGLDLWMVFMQEIGLATWRAERRASKAGTVINVEVGQSCKDCCFCPVYAISCAKLCLILTGWHCCNIVPSVSFNRKHAIGANSNCSVHLLCFFQPTRGLGASHDPSMPARKPKVKMWRQSAHAYAI